MYALNQIFKFFFIILTLGTFVLVTGCATGTYVPPDFSSQPSQYERIVNKPFDATWASLVDYASQAFFGIDNFEKASGLMTLNFGSSNPSKFIDCGRMTVKGGVNSADMPYAKYLSQRFGATLKGRMNLVVRALQPNKTKVQVNARYVFTLPANQQIGTPQQVWSFDSGGKDTINIAGATRGTISTRTCRPTYVAEQAILDAVSN